jgi:uroporphyrinogen III methyltransferase/synthase
MSQNSINNEMLKYARQGKIVCRLKGGDPFVFGRGGEEALFLRQNHIPVEVICGITSATSVPASAGIPVTHRDYASSFHVITGHNPQANRTDWRNIANYHGTVIFLMGGRKIREISRLLIENGKPDSSRIVIISNGTLPEQQVMEITLLQAATASDSFIEQIKRPSLFLIGDVIKLRTALKSFRNNLSLSHQ